MQKELVCRAVHPKRGSELGGQSGRIALGEDRKVVPLEGGHLRNHSNCCAAIWSLNFNLKP